MRSALLLIVLGVYVGLGVPAIAVWRAELPLWTHAVAVNPANERALSNYAKARVAAGDRAWLPR